WPRPPAAGFATPNSGAGLAASSIFCRSSAVSRVDGAVQYAATSGAAWVRIHLPFSLPAYFWRSSAVVSVMRATSPRTRPLVPAQANIFILFLHRKHKEPITETQTRRHGCKPARGGQFVGRRVNSRSRCGLTAIGGLADRGPAVALRPTTIGDPVMTSVPAPANQPEAPLFTDGLGDRVVAVDAATGDLLQILRVRPQLLAVPSFEFALRERAARLANFRHAYYARVRRIDRHPTGLAIVSDHVEGVRLSEMLRVAQARNLQLDLNAALCLLRQLVPSLALLHENARDVAHGLIGPERLIVTPRARLIVVEHVLGSAVEQLQFKRERLWQELRVAVPASAGAIRFDHRLDVTAI